MTASFFTIKFNAHVARASMLSMINGMAYGSVVMDESGRTLELEVFRPSNLERLEHQFSEWNRNGFLRWFHSEGSTDLKRRRRARP